MGGANIAFQGRLSAEFPSQIVADITECCNLACSHCAHGAFKRSEHYGGRHLDPALNAKMIDEVREHGRGYTRFIRYSSNGEPLLHPNGCEMVADAARRSGVCVALTTNGTLLSEEKAAGLLRSGVHVIDVSIDACSPETYAKIRVGADLGVTRENVRRLIRLARESRSAARVVVSFIEQPLNRHEVADFEAFWRREGADAVVIRRIHSHSGAKADLARERRERNRSIPRRPCLYPWERIVLNARGDLAFCPSDWVHGSAIADYREATIRETWRGAFYRSLREAHVRNDLLRFPFCRQCPDWEATRWPEEGRSYADMIEDFTKARDAGA